MVTFYIDILVSLWYHLINIKVVSQWYIFS
nr:MAG TPA: hypothetical protein [Inoviridae sp.]